MQLSLIRKFISRNVTLYCIIISLNISFAALFQAVVTFLPVTLSPNVAFILIITSVILFHILNLILQLPFYVCSEAKTGFPRWESENATETDSNQTMSLIPVESHLLY